MSRAAHIKALAPIAPPCFSTRSQWVVYLEDAAAEQRPGHAPGPLIFEAGQPVRFNSAFSFCRECTDRHEGAMRAAGKCQPRFLLTLPVPSKELA